MKENEILYQREIYLIKTLKQSDNYANLLNFFELFNNKKYLNFIFLILWK